MIFQQGHGLTALNTTSMHQVSVPRLREQGHEVYRSPNGVLLTRQVPPTCITGLLLISKRARKAEAHLRELLKLDGAGEVQE